MMYKKLLKIFLVHLSIILYWGLLYKTENIIKAASILNTVSIILFMTLYAFIYTEISNKKIPSWVSTIFILISTLSLAMVLRGSLNNRPLYGIVSLVSTSIYVKKFMIYRNIQEINILPISKSATNVFAIMLLLVSLLIIYLFDIESFMINVFYNLIFLVIESFFVLFLKEKEDTYEKIYQLYYLSDYMSKERDDFARVIHDDIIQDIFASRNYLSLKQPDIEYAKDILTKLEHKSRQIMRFYQSNLFEKVSLELSLSAIFDNVAALYPDKKIKVEKMLDSHLVQNKEDIRVISVISKELVNNIYKHSEATYINYHLYKKEELIIIELESDGASLEDFENIKESRRGVLLVSLLVDSNSGNINYAINEDILFTRVVLEVEVNEDSFIR